MAKEDYTELTDELIAEAWVDEAYDPEKDVDRFAPPDGKYAVEVLAAQKRRSEKKQWPHVNFHFLTLQCIEMQDVNFEGSLDEVAGKQFYNSIGLDNIKSRHWLQKQIFRAGGGKIDHPDKLVPALEAFVGKIIEIQIKTDPEYPNSPSIYMNKEIVDTEELLAIRKGMDLPAF